MTIVIIDDSPYRCRRVEESLETMGIKCITFYSLKPAVDFIKWNQVDGIITDMNYPINENSNSEVKGAGNLLLKWLILQKKNIPVLGNSFCQFNTDYPYYRGKMPGYCHLGVLAEFVSSINKDHD